MGDGGLSTPAPKKGHPRLIADIGGTHARLAWIAAPGAPVDHVKRYVCAEHASIEALIHRYRTEHSLPMPSAAALGVAAHVGRGTVQLTNSAWRVDVASLAASLGGAVPFLCNDFAALARGLSLLGPDEAQAVGGGRAARGAPRAVVGPGTGLGVAGLLEHAGSPVVVSGEGGHTSLAAETPEEHAIVQWLSARIGRVFAESVLSGPGLVTLYQAVCALRGRVPVCTSPAAVLEESHDEASAAVEHFLGWLGAFAGDIALIFDARGGVYLAGGVVAAMGARLAHSSFRQRFEAKGHFSSSLRETPTWRILDAPLCALRGADALLDDHTVWRTAIATVSQRPA
ncbi:MAG TPA: glucokinase [Caldimonas sp.]|nr:glucokinase [Caldimonas sp.]